MDAKLPPAGAVTVNAVEELQHKYPLTWDGLRDALRALGDDPGRVARELRRLGIKGRRGECAACPIAVYCDLIWPDATLVEVDGGVVTVHRFDTRVCCDMPVGVVFFIDRFDTRHFPDLDLDPR